MHPHAAGTVTSQEIPRKHRRTVTTPRGAPKSSSSVLSAFVLDRQCAGACTDPCDRERVHEVQRCQRKGGDEAHMLVLAVEVSHSPAKPTMSNPVDSWLKNLGWPVGGEDTLKQGNPQKTMTHRRERDS